MPKNKLPRIFVLIPARYGSQRFPGKMLASVSGKSLIQRTYENAQQAPFGSSVLIATDDPRIAQHSREFGAEVVMTSPHCSNGTERIIEALQARKDIQEEDIILNIQGDEPCIPSSTLEAVVNLLIENPSLPMATALTPLPKSEYSDSSVVKAVRSLNGNALYFSRALIPCGVEREGAPFFKHLGVYAYRKKFLMAYGSLPATPLQMAEDLEQLKVLEHGYSIGTVVVPEDSIGVNTKEDLRKLEEYLCKQNISSSQAELSQV